MLANKSDNYYIPSIEEFVLGFEYEFHGTTVGGLLITDLSKPDRSNDTYIPPTVKVWTPEIMTDDILWGRSLKQIQELITNGQIRAIKK
jgi:hypothetical protein